MAAGSSSQHVTEINDASAEQNVLLFSANDEPTNSNERPRPNTRLAARMRRQKERRAEETAADRSARRDADRQRHAQNRAEETAEQRSNRLASAAARQRQNRNEWLWMRLSSTSAIGSSALASHLLLSLESGHLMDSISVSSTFPDASQSTSVGRSLHERRRKYDFRTSTWKHKASLRAVESTQWFDRPVPLPLMKNKSKQTSQISLFQSQNSIWWEEEKKNNF